MKPYSQAFLIVGLILGIVTLATMGPALIEVHAAPFYRVGASIEQALAAQATPLPPAANLPPAIPDAISLSRFVDPPFLIPGQESGVSIRLEGIARLECLGAPARPLDAMLVYDVSSSAGSGPGSNWEQTIRFTQALIDQLTQPIYRNRTAPAEQSRLGLITSQTAVTGPVPLLLQVLTEDYEVARGAIATVTPSGDTDIAAGVRLATNALLQAPPDRAKAIILMLHDNVAIDANTIAAVADARGQGIRVYLVANSLNIPPDKQITPDLAAALVEPGNFFANPQPQDLRRLFVTAAEGDPNRVAADIRVADAYAPPGTVEFSAVSGPGGRVEGDRVVWDIPYLDQGQRVELTYRVRLRPGAQGPVYIVGGMAYIDCNGYLYNDIAGEQMPVAPAPTPTPVEVPVGTPTPTPTPTPQPGAIASPTPGPTPTPMPKPPLPSPTTPLFCTSRYWWVPGLLLPLLLVLLLMLLLWWWGRQTGFNWRYEWEQRNWRCRIPILLLLLHLLFLAFLIGRELTVGLCKPSEAVYFWRMVGHERGIYLTEPDLSPGDKPVPFEAVNREGCVGCHAVSSASGLIAVSLEPVPGHGFVKTLTGEKVTIPEIDPVYWAWSPDGKKLAFSSAQGDIYLIDLTTNEVKPLAGASEPNVAETMPAWSADGATIAFVRSNTPLYFGLILQGPCDIYTVPANGGVAQPLPGASGHGFNYYPAYSPDGKWLAFTRHTTGSSSYADAMAEIYLVPAHGGQARRLAANDAADGTTLTGVSNSWPTWSRDGRFLAFNSKRNDPAYDVFITEIDDEGNSGPAIPLAGASAPGVFEHTPYWGKPIQPLPLWKRLLSLWPWLLPLIPLLLLIWLLCRRARPPEFRPWEKENPRGEPGPIPPWKPAVSWDPGAALIIGLGGSGRWVLTHLKKNLLDAGSGTWPEQVRLLLLDTSEDEMVGGKQVPVAFAGVELAPEEKLAIAHDLRELTRRMYEDPHAEPEMQGWYPARDYQEHLPSADLDLARGTHQRRPLGRAGLFRHIHDRGERSVLYQRLVEGLRAVKERVEDVERAHVIIVGSLAGGMGSATFFDMAYLVRRAARDAGVEGSINVEGFLIAEGAFQSITTDEMPRVNTFATLRELSRFQLSRGRPYPMIYRLDAPEGSVQNDYLQWGLFDSLYVVDWAGFLSGERPENGIFPAVADVLTVLMDRASRARENAIQPFRDGARNTATRAQALRGEAVMGTFGQLAYRLPFTEIVEQLKARFAEDLLREYLVGPDYKGEDLVLKKEQNREEPWGSDLHKEVLKVLGVHWYPAPSGPSPLLIGGALGFLGGLFAGAVLALATLAGWWLWVGIAAGVLIGVAVGAWMKSRQRPSAGQELYLALPEGAPPEPAVVAAITHAETTDQARFLILPRLADVGSDPDGYVASRREAFRRYLLSVVAYMLNGRAESSVIEARTGKLGYALAFLNDLRDTLNAGAGQVQFLSAGFIGPEKANIQTFHRMATALVSVVDEVKADLEAHALALTGRRESEPGVYYHLLQRQWELRERRKEMDRVLVRRYLWTRRAERGGQMVDEDLVVSYYRDYLSSHLERSLDQFHWRIVEKGGRPSLQLYFMLEHDVPLEGNAPERFAQALQELGGRLLKDLWDQKGQLLADVMTSHLSHTNLPLTAQELCERSVPLAGHDPRQASVPPAGAVDITPHLYQAKAFLYINRNVVRQSELGKAVEDRMEGVPVEILPATDPFTCSLLQFREVVPLSAFDFYHRSEVTYRTNYGIAERGRRAHELGWREPPHVFAAERNALMIEQRLPEIEEVPWPFHPLFIPALENLDRARLFALALLNGYIRREGGERYRYRLQLPTEKVDIALGWPEDAVKPEAQLVVAMRTFVVGQPAEERRGREEAGTTPGLLREAVPGPHEVARLAEQVRHQLERDQKQLLSRLEALEKVRFISRLEERRQALIQALPPYLREEAARPGGRELIAFLRLVAKDEYETRRQKGKSR